MSVGSACSGADALRFGVRKFVYKVLAVISKFVYYLYIETQQGEAVKQSEFVKWLEGQGAQIKNGTKHLKVYLNGKQTTVPRHPGKEISNRFVEVIKKQLDIK